MILLSLASRQIWPQVLSVLHLRPERLELFHSDEEKESKGPAVRLKTFIEKLGLAPDGVNLHPVPHDDFGKLVDCLGAVAEARMLDGTNCRLNLTGGNKLMAMAASEWARLNGVPCFYLERNLQMFPFFPVGTELQPQPSLSLDPHLAKDVDPLDLLRCQMDAAEIVGPGQRLTLSNVGKSLSEDEVRRLSISGSQGDAGQYLVRDGPPPRNSNPGDALELLTALALLKLGVPSVRRGIRLKSGSGRGHWQDEGELDLVFNWSGKLWIVDCKHRVTAESRVQRLRAAIQNRGLIDTEVAGLLDRVEEELRDKELKPLKEDILAVTEAGGLLGRALAVRVNPLPEEAVEFARSRRLPVIMKDNLLDGLRAQLHPNQPASLEMLRQLSIASNRATA